MLFVKCTQFFHDICTGKDGRTPMFHIQQEINNFHQDFIKYFPEAPDRVLQSLQTYDHLASQPYELQISCVIHLTRYVGYWRNSDYLSSQQELMFATFEKIRPRPERKLKNILFKILVEIINLLINIYIYMYIYCDDPTR